MDSVILAKYDSTAKGGAVVSLCRDLGLPISFVGTGEKLEDLEPFDERALPGRSGGPGMTSAAAALLLPAARCCGLPGRPSACRPGWLPLGRHRPGAGASARRQARGALPAAGGVGRRDWRSAPCISEGKESRRWELSPGLERVYADGVLAEERSYDGAGRLLAEKIFAAGALSESRQYRYGLSGLSSVEIYGPDGALRARERYELGPGGELRRVRRESPGAPGAEELALVIRRRQALRGAPRGRRAGPGQPLRPGGPGGLPGNLAGAGAGGDPRSGLSGLRAGFAAGLRRRAPAPVHGAHGRRHAHRDPLRRGGAGSLAPGEPRREDGSRSGASATTPAATACGRCGSTSMELEQWSYRYDAGGEPAAGGVPGPRPAGKGRALPGGRARWRSCTAPACRSWW